MLCRISQAKQNSAEDSAEGAGATNKHRKEEGAFFLPVEGLGRLREGYEALDWDLKTR